MSVVVPAVRTDRGRSEELTDLGVPHVVVIDDLERLRDVDRDRVPAALRRILGIEVVGRVLAGAATFLHDVLVVVADDDREVTVALNALLGDRLQRPASAVAVCLDDGGGYRPGELAGVRERRPPVVDRLHVVRFMGRHLNGVGRIETSLRSHRWVPLQ